MKYSLDVSIILIWIKPNLSFKTDEAISLNHVILAHHGLNEYGSPKEPLMGEAALIYMLDYSDSRFASLEKYYKNTEKGEYTDPIFAFDKKSFYIPTIVFYTIQ